MRGLRDSTPRGLFGGPLLARRLYFITALQYDLQKKPDRTLPFPFNESKQESVNSLTQLDYIVSPNQLLTGTFHFSPQHINFVNPGFFNPQPVTPSYAQHAAVATLSDHLGIRGGTLDSTLSIQHFDATIGPQGNGEMVLTPIGNRGNYFSTQDRDAGRTQWIETWSPAQIEHRGAHDMKFGTSLMRVSEFGGSVARPIDILDLTGLLLRRIEFLGGSSFHRGDLETSVFAQDHWSLNPRLALDFGARFDRQNIAQSMRIAPRLGLAWSPLASGWTVIRGGYGTFYDRVPLSVYSFSHFPHRLITDYGPDGSIIGTPTSYVNALGTGTGSLLTSNRHTLGNFAPRSATWNVQIEQRISRLVRLRALYANSRSAGLVVLDQNFLDRNNTLPLNGRGRSIYRQAELSARIEWKNGQQFFLGYTHSRAQGSLNDFSNFVGNFPTPLIHPNVFSNLSGDLPNRFLAWGSVNVFRGLQFLPLVEYRTGFPYTQFDVLGNYVGTPNNDKSRFPGFFNADARLLKDLKVNPKYTLRFSVSGFNLTNHFNALAVHANIADPQYGTFFGNYHLRYRADFDVLF
jgi:hypothetical protein